LPFTVATTSAEGERWHPDKMQNEAPPIKRRAGTTKRARKNDATCKRISPPGCGKTPGIQEYIAQQKRG
jgi:hypothetical protein